MGEYTGLQGSAQVKFGSQYHAEDLDITPSVSLRYVHLRLNDYTETGAGDGNLTVDKQDYSFLYAGFDTLFSRTFATDSGSLTPEFHIGYLYEALDEAVETTSQFTGGGAAFTTSGFDPANHSINAGLGLTFASHDGFGVKATYDLEVKEDYLSHSAVFRLEWKF